MDFTIHTIENAPEQSKPMLEAAQNQMGFLPNLMAEFAAAPAVLKGYLKLDEAVRESSFSSKEQQLAILAVSIENECDYCTAVHSTVLKNQIKADEDLVNAVRNGERLKDDKLNALVTYARKVVRQRGRMEEQDLVDFTQAGYNQQNILELNLIVALKTISNYTNHMANTPLDDAFVEEKVKLETA